CPACRDRRRLLPVCRCVSASPGSCEGFHARYGKAAGSVIILRHLPPARNLRSSWPGLPRPSTPYFFTRQDVDARHKAGHDVDRARVGSRRPLLHLVQFFFNSAAARASTSTTLASVSPLFFSRSAATSRKFSNAART